MRRIWVVTSLMLLLSGLAMAQIITGAANAASFLADGLPNGGLAQGSVATFFLRDLGLADKQVDVASSTPLTPNFAGVSVQLSAGGLQIDALPIVVVGPDAAAGRTSEQVSAVIPSNTPTGQATVVISGPGGTTPPFTVTIVANALGLFALNQGGSGPGIFTNPLNNNAVNLITAAYSPGDLADIWATGLGPVNFSEVELPIIQDLRGSALDVRAFFGGQEVEVVYAGRTGCCIGLDLIRIRLPNIVGCYVPVVIIVNGIPSNTVTISISDSGGVCSAPNGLTADDISNAQQSGAMNLGTISLGRTSFQLPNPLGGGSIQQTTDTGSASFRRFTSAQLFSVQSFSGLFTPGACLVFQFPVSDDDDDVPNDLSEIDPVEPVQFLDAGAAINLAHSQNGNRTLDLQSLGNYFATLGGDGFGAQQPLYLSRGTITFNNGNGGAVIGAFNQSANFPDALTWTNRDNINGIPSGQDLLITWTGGQGTVIIFGGSLNRDKDVGAGFLCQSNASAGQFPVPSWVVDSMPPSGLEEGVPTGLLSVGNAADPVRFDAPNLDVGFINFNTTELKFVGYHIDVPDQGNGGGGGNGGGFALSSSSFASGAAIPAKHAATQCGGSNTSPEISWGSVPTGTQTFLVVMDDQDAAGFLHWALWDIPGTAMGIPEGNSGNVGTAGQNDLGQAGYGGPCPPPGENHTYRIRVFALPFALNLPPGTGSNTLNLLINQVGAAALATASYTGTFGQ